MKAKDLMIKSIKINNPGISKEILDAFCICDRKFFVKEAYDDEPKHIAHGQTISQPSTIARMISLLRLEKGLDVLEIGTNTGYHSILVSWLVFPGKVKTIEIFSDLVKEAKKNIKKLITDLKRKKKENRLSKIEVFTGDALDKGTGVWNYKYDRIYFTAGVDSEKKSEVKKMALKLLKNKGILLYPTRESWDYGALEIWEKNKNELKLIMREVGYSFVPLLRKEDLKKLYEKRNKKR